MFERFACALSAVASSIALLACVPAAGDSAVGAAAASTGALPAGTPVADTRDIVGQWDVVSFQGYRPPRLQGTTRAAIADFDENGFVALRIGCNGSGATGAVRNGRFLPRPGDRIQTLMGCGREREARDAALFGFFDRAPSVERLANGRLRLVAGDDVLELERPAQRRLAFLPRGDQLLGEWRMVELVRYDERGGIAGIGMTDVPGRIVFDGITASYTPCPALAFRYRLTNGGRIIKLNDAPLGDAATLCRPLNGAMPGYGMPEPRDALRLLHTGPHVELVDAETILVSNERYGLLLTKRAPET